MSHRERKHLQVFFAKSYVTALVLTSLSGLLLGCSLNHSRALSPVVVNWNTTHQVIDGFGASATGYADGFTPQQADQFFNPETGLGLSLLRIRPIADTLDTDCGCVANSEPHRCVQGLKSQIVSGDLLVAESASARGARLFATPWSPPAYMKTSGTYCSGGSIKGDPADYSKYAGQLANFVSLLGDHKLSIEALSVQNEPDIENEYYDTCRWNARQIHDFIPYLSKALADSGYGNIRIATPEQSSWAFDLMNESMSDPAVASRIGLVLGHAYETETPSGLPSVGERHVWETEVGDSRPFDGGISDGLRWARSIHNYMTIGANAWMYWSLACGKTHFNHANNMCLTGPEERLAKRAYVLGQFAKFIRPGWQRLGVLNKGGLLVTAYKGSERKFAIVVINMESADIQKQSFFLKGVTSARSRIIPWLTSASASLEAQPALALDSNGSTFAYTIPGKSVVTFQGQGD
jgi:glucuronoarabinoxylan endo-1,4-beta-xylanase